MVGLTAWMAGTAIAVSVAWLGADVVVRNAGVGPGMPVINSAVLPSAAASLPAASLPPTTPPGVVTPPASAGGTAPRHAVVTPSASGAPVDRASASVSASPSAGDVRAYTLAGGNVTLEVTGDTAQLITAVPDAGYSVMTWSGTDWLRVDFSSGAQVSSLIASWYQHAPTVSIEN